MQEWPCQGECCCFFFSFFLFFSFPFIVRWGWMGSSCIVELCRRARVLGWEHYDCGRNVHLTSDSAMKPCRHVVCVTSASKSAPGRPGQRMSTARTRQPPKMAVTRLSGQVSRRLPLPRNTRGCRKCSFSITIWLKRTSRCRRGD